jgi:predicted  nucleic acid-binding Zn-ribbon protein
MPQIYIHTCTECGEIIEYTYERHVYENCIQCPKCEEFNELEVIAND